MVSTVSSASSVAGGSSTCNTKKSAARMPSTMASREKLQLEYKSLVEALSNSHLTKPWNELTRNEKIRDASWWFFLLLLPIWGFLWHAPTWNQLHLTIFRTNMCFIAASMLCVHVVGRRFGVRLQPQTPDYVLLFLHHDYQRLLPSFC
ncbi:unnamed protein product [Amoebophrya sp. A25]|nr:unnamed protein product [Amoebophrya sp. A25]|eukprot:GSA25T00001778001.1